MTNQDTTKTVYEVQTYTICEGWVNCWMVDDTPQTFETIEEARAELDEFFADIKAQIQSGERGKDEGFDREEFRIVAKEISPVDDENQRTQKIKQLNDQCRKQIFAPQWGRSIACNVHHTEGIEHFSDDDRYNIYLAIRDFDDFTEDNDPHGEHDFGAFDYNGHKIFWKIDYYDRSMQFGSEDPADPKQTMRVLTIMLAEEY